MNVRQQGMARARQEIVQAAGAEFALHGYEGTSFARIAAAMNKPKSAIGYHLFPSKESLALAVIAAQEERWRASDAVIDAPAGARRWTFMVMTSSKELFTTPVAAGAVRLLHELPQSAVHIEKTFNWRDYTRAQMRAEMASLGKPTEVDDLADLLLDASFGVIYTAIPGDGSGIELRLATLIGPLLRGMGIVDADMIVADAASFSAAT